MLGYYVHHHGSGHLHRALAIQSHASAEIVGLSSLPRPRGWRGDWSQLADDADPILADLSTADHTAQSRLHYVPYGHPGLRTRMARLSAWFDSTQPRALVVDVSVEVALLARLHGIPVITMAQPGSRTDQAHSLGYGVSAGILAPWPSSAHGLWSGVGTAITVGPIARFAIDQSPVRVHPRRVVVLNGTGGGRLVRDAQQVMADLSEWEWIVLDRESGTWVDDPWSLIRSAAVIISHCGQNSVAEISAARRPAILMPQDRPFDEQRRLAEALSDLPVPATVLPGWPDAPILGKVLDRTAELEGADWASWNDGLGATRAAAYLDDLDRHSVQAAALAMSA